MKKLISLLLTALLLSACLPQNVQIPQSPLLPALERKSGLLAYIGIDGNVYVSDQAGNKLKQLTKDATTNQSGTSTIYQLPTWSSDGNQLAYIGTSGTSAQATSKIYVANIQDDSVKPIFSSEKEFPFYLYWSPDESNVTFLSTAVSGQTMLLQSAPVDGSQSTVIDTGSPYYWSWAPNGHTLITHSGGSTTSTTPEHLAFIQLQDSGIIEDGLDETPASFQAPAWSPDGSQILLTRLQDGKQEIILTDSAGKYEKTLGTFKLNTAFAWSSDSKRVAFIEGTQTMTAGVIGNLKVVDLGTSKTVTAGENVVAFYWSPNGQKLAYFIPKIAGDSSSASGSTSAGSASPTLLLELDMFDVATGKSNKLFTYQPTDPFVNLLPYFDQYHQSNTIWSPDNNNIVLSFIDNQGTPGIAIVAASGQMEPRILTQGLLAFWSWK
jgi:Tol biopolymer transport system component